MYFSLIYPEKATKIQKISQPLSIKQRNIKLRFKIFFVAIRNYMNFKNIYLVVRGYVEQKGYV